MLPQVGHHPITTTDRTTNTMEEVNLLNRSMEETEDSSKIHITVVEGVDLHKVDISKTTTIATRETLSTRKTTICRKCVMEATSNSNPLPISQRINPTKGVQMLKLPSHLWLAMRMSHSSLAIRNLHGRVETVNTTVDMPSKTNRRIQVRDITAEDKVVITRVGITDTRNPSAAEEVVGATSAEVGSTNSEAATLILNSEAAEVVEASGAVVASEEDSAVVQSLGAAVAVEEGFHRNVVDGVVNLHMVVAAEATTNQVNTSKVLPLLHMEAAVH